MEWHTPRNAFANAIPAIVAAFAIFSRASGSFGPLSYARGRYLNIVFNASSARPSVNSVAIMEAYASRAWVTASMPEALVSPFGADICISASTIAIFGISS